MALSGPTVKRRSVVARFERRGKVPTRKQALLMTQLYRTARKRRRP